jgi:hypothetical protein
MPVPADSVAARSFKGLCRNRVASSHELKNDSLNLHVQWDRRPEETVRMYFGEKRTQF